MSDSNTTQSRAGIQVIARAAAILRTLKDNQTGLSLGQIAERVDLPRSTVQRIVGALQTERLVMFDASGRGLRLGPELHALADATRHNIVEHCRPLLSDLSQRTGETADLSALRGNVMVFLDQVPGAHRLRTESSVGEVFPLTTSANGRACLASLPPEDARKLVTKEWITRELNGDPGEFLARLDTIRRDGIAYDLDEHTDGISAAGIAFRDWSGDLHAISVPVPSTRFEAQRSKIEAAIRHVATRVQKVMSVSD